LKHEHFAAQGCHTPAVVRFLFRLEECFSRRKMFVMKSVSNSSARGPADDRDPAWQ
jgi:hypothetical protein